MPNVAVYTSYAYNKINDAVWRGQALGAPATVYAALLKIRGKWTASTAMTTSSYVVPNAANGRLYRCTTAGTTAASEPTWPTTNGGTVTDGGAVWTEQTSAMEGGTFAPEVSTSGTNYARASITASLASWAGTQGAGTTTASSGSSGLTSNNSAITWGVPSADWTPSGGDSAAAGVLVMYDASTGGNAWSFQVLNNVQTILNGNAAPSAAAGAVSFGLLP